MKLYQDVLIFVSFKSQKKRKKYKAEKKNRKNNDGKLPIFGKRLKPTDSRISENSKWEKRKKSMTRLIIIKLLKTKMKKTIESSQKDDTLSIRK